MADSRTSQGGPFCQVDPGRRFEIHDQAHSLQVIFQVDARNEIPTTGFLTARADICLRVSRHGSDEGSNGRGEGNERIIPEKEGPHISSDSEIRRWRVARIAAATEQHQVRLPAQIAQQRGMIHPADRWAIDRYDRERFGIRVEHFDRLHELVDRIDVTENTTTNQQDPVVGEYRGRMAHTGMSCLGPGRCKTRPSLWQDPGIEASGRAGQCTPTAQDKSTIREWAHGMPANAEQDRAITNRGGHRPIKTQDIKRIPADGPIFDNRSNRKSIQSRLQIQFCLP